MYKFPQRFFVFITLLTFSLASNSCTNKASEISKPVEEKPEVEIKEPDSLLRHVVLFEFNEKATVDIVKNIEQEFAQLPKQISEIYSYEWGLNNSPEGLNHGLTHCFFVTFLSEDDRAIYLPHPSHQKFVKFIGPFVESVTVVDYWTK